MARLAWVGVLVLVSAMALASSASARAASPPTMRLLLTDYGVWEDGRYLMYREATGPSYDDAAPVIFDAQTLAVVRRLTLPSGCMAISYRFGKVLLRCPWPQAPGGPSPYTWGLIHASTGEVTMLPHGTENNGYRDGYGPFDTFSGFSRYWLIGSRDENFYSNEVYVNLKTRELVVIDRDPMNDSNDDNKYTEADDPNLGRYEYRRCGGYRPRHYEIHTVPNTSDYGDVFLYNCEKHTRKLIGRCARGCHWAHGSSRWALWLSHDDRRLYARRFTGRRTCVWKLPQSAYTPRTFPAGGRIFAHISRQGPLASELRVARPRRC